MKWNPQILFIFGTEKLSNCWVVNGKYCSLQIQRFLTNENRKVDGTDGLDSNLATKTAFVAVDTLIILWSCPRSFMLHVFSEIADSLPCHMEALLKYFKLHTIVIVTFWWWFWWELPFAFLNIAIVARYVIQLVDFAVVNITHKSEGWYENKAFECWERKKVRKL